MKNPSDGTSLPSKVGTASHSDTTSLDSTDALARAMADAAQFLNEPAEDVDTLLGRLAEVAARTIPDVDVASISVVSGDKITTKAASDQSARDLDQLQYDLQEGPCIDALLAPDKAEFVIDDMEREERWARYVPAAARLGFRSQMGIEIYRERRSVGGLNLYSSQANVFDDQTRATAEIFAVHAAVALDKVHTVSTLNEALASRLTIGQAVGIVMRTYTITDSAAFNYLVRVSQHTHTKLRDVAARVVASLAEEANRKSR